ncbi:uncharacterized protein GGS22DRAFT_190934 [Annulohypoxylon maeteangense]|uniref:uncharacterized protein n=1 Tax=Annulohypoxylon maeteangense TaxID=1927788 RepID=UPI002007CB33|nr:uncharacterized protein GGS22DRAFT_190934 [Annulohypoxylon maeteangense]KAI0882956.1 hypothetical protein GGS22DRAFT_190934 [Annulohypoxylon maeteangense]
MTDTPLEPIAVIGFGCRFPGGADTPSKLWSVLRNPENLSKKPPTDRFNVDAFYHPVGTHHGTTNATQSYWLEDSERSNVAQFDAGFFNIQPAEVDAMDPQQRILMEVVYDGLCASGQPMEKLRGSDTAVYVGLMCDDYQSMLTSDWETFPRYTVTGVERGILANRLSYFFDWHGPSMTVDTACSSSMVALDQAVQVLRSGKSKMAVAAGANLILTPVMHINEASLGMLSPSGRCAMWDTSADGYTRGEGIAAVFVKTLSQALADNDPIQCILRETGVNQDGRTPGLTMPSSSAQAQLIRDCYARIGLDPVNNPRDRPQFFQAHGTGTQAGDPQEAAAISTAFFPSSSLAANEGDKMLVGSIKTVIGHTEGTAGVASIIATSLALKNGIVPPNLHFHNLNPKVAPFFNGLAIPTTPIAWPTENGEVKRASVNSFGFGGTNTHAILEEYVPIPKAGVEASSSLLFTPLTFSAHSETALRNMLSWHLDYFLDNPNAPLADVAYTLQHRRSTLTYRKAIAAATVEEAVNSLKELTSDDTADLSTRFGTPQKPKVLGVFTGQGAQWPRMGAQLIESSPFAASRIDDLDAALQSLSNPADRPTWTLKEQLLAGKEESRIAEAALSQPLCTAVQVILVDILREAGISFTAVVGHSSGEIGAAYASGLVTAEDAIRIAYFRGVHAKLASSPNPHRPRGAMIAVGTSAEEAYLVCAGDFAGRLQVAAVNSSSSITLSGDEDAVDEAEKLFRSRNIFARKLKVDTAYHSAHMDTSAGPYLTSLQNAGFTTPKNEVSGTTWFSSVREGEIMTQEKLSSQYWADNMCNAVLFAGALAQATHTVGDFDLAIEVGPHPALKGPAMATIGDIPYTGLLSRGQNDIEQLSAALGYVWTQLGFDSVQFSAVQTLLSGNESKTVLDDLPPYPFEHQRTYWTESRIANHFKNRSTSHAPNPVLGTRCAEANTPGEISWRNVLRQKEISWLKGHMLQGQTVFPATGYVSMAIEAIKAVALDSNPDIPIGVLKLDDVEIGRAITFDDDNSSVETIFSISSVDATETAVSAEWACYSVLAGSTVLNAKGRVQCQLSTSEPDEIPLIKAGDNYDLVNIDEKQFYDNLSGVGYGYSPPFQGLSNIRRKLGYGAGTLSDQSGSAWEDNLVLHPGTLDSALQTVFAAWAYPGDPQIWSLHVPVSIAAITINPYYTALGAGGKQGAMQFETYIRSKSHSKIVGDIYLNAEDGSHASLQMEGATMVPFSPATSKNDLPMFSHFQHTVASPDGELSTSGERLTPYEVQVYKDVDRVSYWYARNISKDIPAKERHGLLPHYQNYLKWCDRMVDMVSRGELPKVSAECNADTRDDITRILAQYQDRLDIRFVQAVGDNLEHVIREGTSMLEYMNKDGMLRAFYEENALCAGPTTRWLARILSQISSRYPGANILEVGAGTGATTSAILGSIGEAYASYTFTDISSGFFMAAEERFGKQTNRMVFKTFNMEKEPASQGYVEGEYDVVVAVNVLHVSVDMENTLANVRRLLKPGGFLVVGELTSTDLLFTGMTVGTLPGWWIGAETGRTWGPLLNLNQWDSTLKNTGFAGIDTVTPDISASLPFSVFVAQAVDDKISMLRNPLAVEKHPEGINTDNLAIIGGTTYSVNKLGRDTSDILSYRFRNKQFFNTIEEFASSEMANAAAITVLSLTDLDEPYLKNLTKAKFEGLKTLFAAAGTLVWLTQGSREDNPYNYMMAGLINTIKTEYPTMTAQTYDLDSDAGIEHNTADDLAQMLLRQLALRRWGDDGDLLWSTESQIFISEGKQLITRLKPDTQKNDRYNARRRDVFAAVNPIKEALELVGTSQGQDRALELRKVSPLVHSQKPSTQYRTVRITHSLLQSVAVGTAGFFRLCVGTDVQTGDLVLALSDSNRSPANIPAYNCIVLPETPTASTLTSVAANLISEQILSLTPKGATLLVNEADSAVQSALQAKANFKNIRTIFTTATFGQEKNSHSVFLHPRFPQHVIRSLVPTSTAVFLHFSRGSQSDAVRDVLVNYLPPACVRLSEEALLSNEVKSFSETNLAQILKKAWDGARASSSAVVDPVSLEEVSKHAAIGEELTILDWTSSASVAAKVQTVDSGTLFRADRTYLFVGMAGELGQSLARWMIEHGARYVVLTSRTPKVNARFVEDMESQHNAIVKSVSLDITSPESLRSVHKTITATLPPIGGVMHGAMILDDEILRNMTHEQFVRVAKPKVLGAQLLDELFHTNATLEFFICCSSISSVIGWSGQSNYASANDYMSSLMCNRRKRGVAGSTISIPAVLGVGYAAHSAAFDFEYIKSIGYTNIGEEDLHALFAEAVLSGRPGQASEVKAQVAMGVDYVRADLNVREAHKRDVRFSHFVVREDADGGVKTQGGKAGVRVKVQLQEAKSGEEAYAISRDAFLVHLKRMLRIPAEEKVADSLTLMEQGVDSLVAVDIRSWFMKELEVDVPTLKILGGGTIADLVKTALDKMPSLQPEEAVPVSEETSAPSAAKVEIHERTTSSSPNTAGSPVLSPEQSSSSGTPSEPDSDLTSPPAIDVVDKIGTIVTVTEIEVSDVES